MKRWWVFAGDKYYPWGGMADFQDSFDTQLEAEEFILNEFKSIQLLGNYADEWAQIWDSESKKIVRDTLVYKGNPFVNKFVQEEDEAFEREFFGE